MAIKLLSVDNRQDLRLVVNDTRGVSRVLVIVTGVALCAFKGIGQDFISDTLVIPTGIAVIDPKLFLNAVASAWPASIANDGPSNNAGWAVNRVDVKPPGEELLCALAVRDSDGWVLRVGFRIDALYTDDPSSVHPSFNG